MVVKIVKGLGFLFLLAFASIVFAVFLDYLFYNGLFKTWHRVGTLNGERIIKIVDIGFVETESGDLYLHDAFPYGHYDSDAKWVKISDITSPYIWDEFQQADYCQSFSFLPFGQSLFEDSKKTCIDFGSGTATLVYAINKQGDLYIWSNQHGWEGDGIYKLIILPSLAGILGISIGIVIMVINYVIKHRREK